MYRRRFRLAFIVPLAAIITGLFATAVSAQGRNANFTALVVRAQGLARTVHDFHHGLHGVPPIKVYCEVMFEAERVWRELYTRVTPLDSKRVYDILYDLGDELDYEEEGNLEWFGYYLPCNYRKVYFADGSRSFVRPNDLSVAQNYLVEEITDVHHGSRVEEGLERLRIILEGGAMSQSMPGQIQRLAHDVGGNIEYNFGNVKQNSSGSVFRFGLDMPLQRSGNYTYSLGLSYAYSSLTSSASGSADGPFNMPGLGVGNNPNGFVTGANTPVYYQYNSDSNRHWLDLSLAAKIRLGAGYIAPSIGGSFGRYAVDDSYTFNRPSPPSLITGSYTTNSTVYSAGGYIGLGFEYPIPQSNITMFGLGKAGIDTNWAKSDVSFALTSPLTEYQKVSISNTQLTPDLSLVGGLKFDFGLWDAYLKGGVQYGRYVPNVAIPGGGYMPMLKGETATEYSITGGLQFDLSGFGKAPPRYTGADRFWYFSDARLKRDIRKVGQLANGLNLYRYRYLWSDKVYVGVMAQEVALLEPKAVMHGPDGFLRVDYGRLGLRMMTWDEWLAHGGCARAPAANSDCRMQGTAG